MFDINLLNMLNWIKLDLVLTISVFFYKKFKLTQSQHSFSIFTLVHLSLALDLELTLAVVRVILLVVVSLRHTVQLVSRSTQWRGHIQIARLLVVGSCVSSP